jgi:hypothetical protein
MVSQSSIEKNPERSVGLFPAALPLLIIYASNATAIEIVAHRYAEGEGALLVTLCDSMSDFELAWFAAPEVAKCDDMQRTVRGKDTSQIRLCPEDAWKDY